MNPNWYQAYKTNQYNKTSAWGSNAAPANPATPPAQGQPVAQQSTQPKEQPQPPQQQQPQQNANAQGSELNKIQQFCLNWMMKNSTAVIEYMLDPSETNKANLTRQTLAAVAQEGLGNVPILGAALNFLGVGNKLGKAVGDTAAAQHLVRGITDFITKNLNIGLIPDQLSGQYQWLQKFDFPDQFNSQISSIMTGLRNKYAKNPEVVARFIQIMLRLKDNMDLMNLQTELVQNALR